MQILQQLQIRQCYFIYFQFLQYRFITGITSHLFVIYQERRKSMYERMYYKF